MRLLTTRGSATSWPKGLSALFALLFTLFYYQPLSAQQCDLACRGGNPDAPISVPIDENCEMVLTPEDILEMPIICPGEKIITVRDPQSNIIVSDTGMVAFDPLPYYEDTLSVNIADVATGVFCNGFLTPVDELPPTLTCERDTISCIMDTSVTELGLPLVEDNCFGEDQVDLTYEDTLEAYGCDSSAIALLQRTWTAVDSFGNTAVCVQEVVLARPELNEVDFPADTVLDCTVPDVDIGRSGQPTLFGEIIENTNGCALTVTYEDDTLSLCSNIEYQVQRSWTVMESCSGTMATDVQLINVVDTVAPQIICPGPITVSTNPAQCVASITLPAPQVDDNCDAEATFFVSTTFGGVGTGPHPFVPVGTHTLRYTAMDVCGNTRVCNTTLNVVDQEPPYAVCEDLTAVSVTSGGIAGVSAITFDDGSNDNCAGELYFKARRMDTGGCDGFNGDDSDLGGYQEWFDDRVFFCCEEVGQEVQVILRVYEVDPGEGPVTPTREIPGGDLFGHFSECMVRVQAQDKTAPTVFCPADTVIDCTVDYEDLSIFGEAQVMDNCNFDLSVEEQVDISECGTGLIQRTFTATDVNGNAGGCVQTITVEDQNPLDEDNIIWPENYTVTACGANVDPNDLPDGYDRPALVDLGCGQVGVNYTDQFYNIAFPACYKILREWVVIDWCRYDPENPSAEGRFSKIQIIKVEDRDDPVLDCPDSRTVGVDDGCGGAYVNLMTAQADDCNANILITNESPFADLGGEDASGYYPLGTTEVKFYASDRCGNVATCQTTVTVQDMSPPKPVCIVGLSVNLSIMNGEPMAMLSAPSFDGGTTDNCTAPDDIKLTLQREGAGIPGQPPVASQLTFTCEDVGTQVVEFWAEDESGNSDFCVTAVAIQDNNAVCPQATASAMVAGDVSTESGQYVEDVMVKVRGDAPVGQTYTGVDGFFEMLDLPMGEDYTIKPERNDAAQNGVSTFDMIQISRHILGVQPLNTPYKMIAADVNQSGNISTLDLITLRKLILGIETEFPNDTPAWRFVDANHLFLNPNNPFATPIPEEIQINELEEDQMDANFVAIKVGDTDLSARTTSLYGDEIEERSPESMLMLNVPEMTLEEGETFTVPFTASGMDEILGYQFTLRFDTDMLEYVELSAGSLPSLSASNFNLLRTEEGWLTTSWNVMDVAPQEAETRLFSITFRARRAVESLSELIEVSGVPTAMEAYNAQGEVLGVGLNVGATITASGAVDLEGYELYQNRPNPFSAKTIIGFKMPVAGDARITVFDMSGQVLYNQEGYYRSGSHEIVIKGSKLAASGLLYYQLRTANYAATKKMILIERR